MSSNNRTEKPLEFQTIPLANKTDFPAKNSHHSLNHLAIPSHLHKLQFHLQPLAKIVLTSPLKPHWNRSIFLLWTNHLLHFLVKMTDHYKFVPINPNPFLQLTAGLDSDLPPSNQQQKNRTKTPSNIFFLSKTSFNWMYAKIWKKESVPTSITSRHL